MIPFDAVNPRGTSPLAVWQMDVTHTPLLAPFSKVHLTVDTSSGFIWATPLKGETARHVIQHTLRCFAVMDSYLIQHGMVLCHSSPGDVATRQWTWMDGLPGYQRAVCDPGELLPRNEIYDSD
ncbi:endogenous retrovirus group K member 11 Pol protein-like [Podarcis lilfordi]|uniref:Endogenous retrovirus group K member 11 Pol protein-like n=1 Tax=Podarcis lilfordi TaxID=74358 RepID=A0AA35P5I1_9SAUR|nr:endogenous retrovirus group K member 11 Pol protein-like [Podarcis lilfordi]